MLKVLHVYRTYFPDTQGGLEEAIRQICIGQLGYDAENRVLTTTEDTQPKIVKFPEATVIRQKKLFEIASCSVACGFRKEFLRQSEWADIINFHFPWPFADLVKLLSPISTPYIITYHSDVVRQRVLWYLYQPLARNFLRRAERVVVTSPNYLESSKFLSSCVRRDQVEVIPLGINDNARLDDEGYFLKKTKCYGEYFFFVGVLRYYKGLVFLIEAAKELACNIVIAGEGPLKDALQKKIERENVENVYLIGGVSDAYKFVLIKESLGVVFPSHLRSEAFGVTLLEGAMCSKPLVTAEIGTGTTYVNVDGETGLVVPPANSMALKSAMARLIKDAPLRRQLGRGARQRYEQLFSSRVLGRSYHNLYQSLVLCK